MKGFDVLKVKSAVKNHNKFDLSRTHLTTMDFGQIIPLFNEETVPGDKFNISGEYFSRMAPLVKPTYGKFSFKTVAGFVPYYMVAEDADAWLAGKTSWEGVTPVQRYITMDALSTFLFAYCCTGAGASSGNCDYIYIDSTGTANYRLWSAQGRYWVNILNSLGYAVPQGVDKQSGSSWSANVASVKLSAYPLLAFFKLYNDYMSQSQRYNTSALSSLLQNIKFNKSVSGSYSATGEITTYGMKVMFDNLKLCYENDYFTSAWQNPNLPLSSNEGITTAAVPANINADYLTGATDDNKLHLGSSSLIGQRSLDFLKSFDDWVRRNNYSGSRSVQQIYSRFGIKTEDYRSHYAEVITTEELPVQVGDVTSTADSTGATLGAYAGKGIMSGSKGFSVNVSDYGLVLVLGYFTVTPMNAYGFDRKVLRNSPLDYYNPEFDGIGADAISLGEFYANPIATSADTTLDTNVFGFTERYNAYRYGRDSITGEFRNYKNTAPMNCWHTGRNLSDVRATGNLVAQSSSVNTLPQYDSEYNRIFSVTSDVVDKFYLTARFKVDAVRPMLNLNQVPRLGEGDTVVPRNGNVIS